MDYIIRNKSLLTGKRNLESLHVFKDFPVFMGCTNESAEKDVKADMSFAICPETGMIQLDKLLPLELVYLAQHNDGVGKIWQKHYYAFASFLNQFAPQRVLEIGGSHDEIFKAISESNSNIIWTVVEPHPLFEGYGNIRVIPRWFDENFTSEETFDTVVHSHVLEHTYDPPVFLSHIGKFLAPGKKHIFTFPNLIEFLKKKYTNGLNFEHTCLLTEPFVDYLLEKNGFRILKKEYFLDHSIFYATEKVDQPVENSSLPQYYDEYKALYMDFIHYYKDLVSSLNEKIRNHQGTVYLFGAHIFSQYLIAFGLNVDRIHVVLDNSDLKNKQRLYGTALKVEKPEYICNEENPAVVVKIANYRDEVVEQLKKINRKVVIFE
jgi:SAM-dependent methyltransferase